MEQDIRKTILHVNNTLNIKNKNILKKKCSTYAHDFYGIVLTNLFK